MSTDDARLRRLLDRQEIAECIARCARGMDRHDEQLSAAYHPGAIDDHGTFVGPASALVEALNGPDGVHASRFSGHQHYLLNQLIDIEDDVAHAETYFLFVGERRDEPILELSGGRYLDRLGHRDGRWAIDLRRTTLEWMTSVPAEAGSRAGILATFTPARWDTGDASYDRPLLARPPAGPGGTP